MKTKLMVGLMLLASSAMAQFAPGVGYAGTTAMHCDSSAFVAWATGCVVERGLQQINKPNYGNASYGTDSDGIGKANGREVVSLGDGGNAVLTFGSPICNEAGPDFAVFENGFEVNTQPGMFFLELAFVEVSSDGEHFFRMPAVSNIQTENQLGGFASMDPCQIHNFAGKYESLYGTPFDLDDIEDNALLNKKAITHVRVIDVIGNIDPQYATYDSEGHPVNDPWPTPFPSGGFDLDAVGVIHDVAHGIDDIVAMEVCVSPNPTRGMLNISAPEGAYCQVFDLLGQNVASEKVSASGFQVDMTGFDNGVYFVRISHQDGRVSVTKVVKQ